MYVVFEHGKDMGRPARNTDREHFSSAWNRDLTSEKDRGGPGVHPLRMSTVDVSAQSSLLLRVILELQNMHH
jgi:hypothetical protein